MATKNLSIEERVWIIKSYSKYENAAEVQRQWKKFFRNKPPTRGTIINLNNKFTQTGSVTDAIRCGRPKTATNKRASTRVLKLVKARPKSSIRRTSLATGISKTSVHRILMNSNFKPYRAQLVQALTADDQVRRVSFCDKWLEMLKENSELSQRVLWSDESTFKLNGTVNRQNSIYWSESNPHLQLQVEQHSTGVCVWAGIWVGGIIGPFFFDGTVTANSYLKMLQTQALPKIEKTFGPNEIYFQQDGAPPHFARNVRDWLRGTFPDHVIGRQGDIEWPPRSCDLTPPDFFLWGYLKHLVYQKQCCSLDRLRARIRYCFRLVSTEMCRAACEGVGVRLQRCVELGGSQIAD